MPDKIHEGVINANFEKFNEVISENYANTKMIYSRENKMILLLF